MAQTFKELLKEFNACQESIEWAGDKIVEQVVNDCHRGDWLLWLAKRIDIDKRKLTLAKGHCANTVKHLMKDKRSIDSVDAAINYGNGLINDSELKSAYAAAAHAYAADAYAAAAYAAAAAAHAYAAAAYAAAAAAHADAAADAAHADAAADAYAAARAKNRMQTATICRMHIGELIISKVNEILNK